MKIFRHVLISRPRNLIIAPILAFSSAALALTPAPANNETAQPPIPGMIEEQTASVPAPAPVVPTSQALPTPSLSTQPQPAPATPEDSEFAKDMETLQQDIALLEQKERKAKLEESLEHYKTPATAEHSSPASDTTETEMSIRSIYGVGRSYQAVIYYRGAELTVQKGTDINGNWKVSSISSSTVRVRNGKTERVLSLSATTQGAQPLQHQSQQLPSAPVMPNPMAQSIRPYN